MTSISKKFASIFALGASAAMLMTPAHALDIKQEQINQCVKGVTDYKVANNSTAKKLCGCQVNVRANMTLGQMWEIESYAQSGKDVSKLPYAKKMQSELQQCAKGLKLNPPQKPS